MLSFATVENKDARCYSTQENAKRQLLFITLSTSDVDVQSIQNN